MGSLRVGILFSFMNDRLIQEPVQPLSSRALTLTRTLLSNLSNKTGEANQLWLLTERNKSSRIDLPRANINFPLPDYRIRYYSSVRQHSSRKEDQPRSGRSIDQYPRSGTSRSRDPDRPSNSWIFRIDRDSIESLRTYRFRTLGMVCFGTV